jgi:hypothetical protein
MIATDATQLRKIVGLVHDHWFDAERITLDKGQRTVAIHLEKRKADLARGSKDGIRLLIKNAEALSVNDSEKVRDYDLDEIKFDAAGNRVIITGGIPITIEVRVTALNIETETLGA